MKKRAKEDEEEEAEAETEVKAEERLLSELGSAAVVAGQTGTVHRAMSQARDISVQR